jgi:hypothetical protein
VIRFEELTGFREVSPSEVRQRLSVDGDRLTSLANGALLSRDLIGQVCQKRCLAKLHAIVVTRSLVANLFATNL